VSERRFIGATAALLIVLSLLVYARALSFGFVNWDDPMLVLENPRIQTFSPSTIVAIFAIRPGHSYQPIRELSHAMDLMIWGDWGPGHHLLNVLLHAAAAVLVLLIARRLGSTRLAAIAAALLFASHPVNVEAVAWVSSRKYGLLAVFGFGALLLHLHARRKSAAACIALAGLSSPFGIIFPALILLVDATRHPLCELRKSARDYLPYLSFLPVLALIVLGLFGGDRTALADGRPVGGIISVSLTNLRVLADYSCALLWPLNLNASYPYLVQTGLGNARALAACAGLIAWIVFAWRQARVGEKRLLLWGGWFLLALAPVANLVPTSTLLADRYLYLAAVGPFLAFGAGLSRLPRRAGVGVLIATVFLMAASAHRRSLVWRDSLSLWTDSVAKSPQNPIALVNLGRALREQGDDAAALARFQAAIEAQSRFPEAYLYVGNSLLRAGNVDGARPYIQRAVELAPTMAEAWSSLGLCALGSKNYQLAVERLTRARALDGEPLDYRVNLALALLPLDAKAAANELWEACLLQPTMWLGAADTLRVKGAPAEALRFYERVPQPRSAAATLSHARCLRDLGRLAESAALCQTILQSAPSHEKARLLLESLSP
jgi:protein O-mannosyl-transferase